MKCIHCGSLNCVKNGTYSNNQKRVQNIKCKDCLSFFAKKSYEGKIDTRPELNKPILRLRKKGMSIRKIAKKLGCAKRTVDKKLKKLLK